MLKSLMFFLFGCSLYFGQNNVSSVSIAEGDGTKTTSTSGQGSGSGNNMPNLVVVQDGGSLKLFLSRSEAKFNSFSLYGTSGMVIADDQKIRPTNSYSVDISNLKPGNYYISVEVVTPMYLSISQQFIKL